eukprot:3164569-Ditylum_brightwellii.AAC.1
MNYPIIEFDLSSLADTTRDYNSKSGSITHSMKPSGFMISWGLINNINGAVASGFLCLINRYQYTILDSGEIELNLHSGIQGGTCESKKSNIGTI